MMSIRCYVAVVIALVPVSFAAAQNRDELLATPKVQEDARPPSYADLTAEQVAEQITVVSGRNYALYGFNTPEIHIILPRVDNSVYAEVDFADPTLFDAGGAEVPHELERGLYDHDTHHDELRLTPVEGEAPVEFARAVGTVTVRYPIRVRTVTARRGEPVTDALDVSFDGPFVTRRSRSDDDDLEATSFTGIEAFRAFDSSGRQLEAYPSAKMSVTGDLVTETMSYWGEVVAVQLDVVDEWVTIRVVYELPEVAPLPEERSGIAPPDGHENPPTPGAKIDVEVVVETPGMVIASKLGVTPDEAIGRLKQLGYPNPSGDFMVMTAVEGNTETLELFLAAGYPIDFAVDGRTALLSAIMYRHIDLAGFLVEAGADVNLADSNNATPLFHAAGICDATELVRALIEAGADPAPATRGNTTAVEMAGVMGCTDNEAIIRAALGE